jgi:hypothetical protein
LRDSTKAQRAILEFDSEEKFTMKVTLKEALARVAKRKDKSPADRDHLARWAADYADDPCWKKFEIAYAPAVADGFWESIIEESLFRRDYAEGVASGIDLKFRERQQARERVLRLAKSSDELADYFKGEQKYPGTVETYRRDFLELDVLENLHRDQAAFLRKHAGRLPQPGVRISRQDRSKHRAGLRKVNAFIDLMNKFLIEMSNADREYAVLALLTEIAFPDKTVDAEFVRKSLWPTTAAARRAISRTHPSHV